MFVPRSAPLAARPGFTAVAMLTLALGIGANTAVYTVVHGVLLSPLPYARPDRVVVLNEVSPQFPNPISVSWQNYVDWRDRQPHVLRRRRVSHDYR